MSKRLNIETKEMRNKKLKQQIFDVALQMMKEVGFENITLRMICQEANISTGMFYQHFENKEDLLSFYYDEAQEEFNSVGKQRLEGLDIKNQLIEFYVWLFEFTSNLGVDFCRNFFSSKNKKAVRNHNLYLTKKVLNNR